MNKILIIVLILVSFYYLFYVKEFFQTTTSGQTTTQSQGEEDLNSELKDEAVKLIESMEKLNSEPIKQIDTELGNTKETIDKLNVDDDDFLSNLDEVIGDLFILYEKELLEFKEKKKNRSK